MNRILLAFTIATTLLATSRSAADTFTITYFGIGGGEISYYRNPVDVSGLAFKATFTADSDFPLVDSSAIRGEWWSPTRVVLHFDGFDPIEHHAPDFFYKFDDGVTARLGFSMASGLEGGGHVDFATGSIGDPAQLAAMGPTTATGGYLNLPFRDLNVFPGTAYFSGQVTAVQITHNVPDEGATGLLLLSVLALGLVGKLRR